MSGTSRILPFGPTCSVLLAVAVAARIVVSFFPCESWGPSSYLCAAAYLQQPLGRSHTCVANAAIPEGVRLSNRLDFLSFRRETLTLDGRGYRNGPDLVATRPRAVLFGSSFSFGMALNDEETFSAGLNRRLGPVVYSAAWTFNTDIYPRELVRTAVASGMSRGWIVVEILNRGAFRFYQPSSQYSKLFDGPLGALRDGYREMREGLVRTAAPAVSFARLIQYPYALTRISSLLNMRLHDNRILPNPFRDQYVEERLVTGRTVLIYSPDKRFSLEPADPGITAEALLLLRDELERSGYRLAVILLPNAYSVYYPLLRERKRADGSERYMLELAGRLSAGNVAVLNLLPPLRDAAARELRSGRMIYFPDDAHWNASGCDIAAGVAAPWLQSLLRGTAAAGEQSSPTTPDPDAIQ